MRTTFYLKAIVDPESGIWLAYSPEMLYFGRLRFLGESGEAQ
jgi:hypothetical protein